MKKIILSGIVLLFICNTLFAQKSNVQFGLKAGVNFATLSDAANTNTDSRAGLHIGGLAHIHLSKSFAVQPEIVYSMQGAEYPNGTKSKLGYVNIPVLGQYMLGQGFRLQTGPQVGILASAEVENGSVEVDIDDTYKKADFGWTFGASYITDKGLGVDARYNLGITDISKNNTDLKNRVWQIGLFYQFRH
jgi:hypothetical protein